MKTWSMLAVVSVAAAGFVACGDDTGGSDDDDGTGTQTGTSTGTGSGTGTGTGNGTGTGTGNGTGTGTGGGTCADEATAAACATCCQEDNQPAVIEVNGIIADTCLCAVGAVCEAECTADCPAPTTLSAGCSACLNGATGAPCVQTALQECAASPTCSPLTDCIASCPAA